MPTYIYKFEDGVTLELTHSIHDVAFESLLHPIKNVLMPVKRTPSKPTVILKGEGFAKNSK